MFGALLYTALFVQPCYAWTTEHVNMPMRDSTLLSTNIFYPDTSIFAPPWPCILSRSPYDNNFPDLQYWTDYWGYVVVGQHLRGYGDSQGIPTAFRTDGWGDYYYGDLRDTYDAVEWLAAQPWSNGKVGMYGFSGNGVVQYQGAGAQPPHFVCGNAAAAFLDHYHHIMWTGGEFRKATVEGWCNMQQTPFLIDTVCSHPDEDSFYTCHKMATRWDSAHYPIIHVAGWYDIQLEGGLSAFSNLQAHHHNQKLFVGPWGHWTWGHRDVGDLQFPINAYMNDVEFRDIDLAWYDYWLHDSANGITEPKVTFYLMGDCDTQDTTLWNFWVEADTWPLPEIQHINYYVREDGLLDTTPPTATAIDTFLYDPGDPCPSYGGKESWYLGHGCGPIDNQPIEGRPDVLLFSTPVLTQPLCVIGTIWFTLYGASDCYDTDWTIRVTDVYPDGRSILITDGILMARHRHGFDIEDSLSPGIPDTFHIDVGSTANVFAPGHRLRVIISSSNYPRFEKNPNTGAPFQRNDPNYITATNSVYRTSTMASHLILPVYPGIPGVAEYTDIPHETSTYLSVPTIHTQGHISFTLRKSCPISLQVFDITGRQCWAVAQNEYSAGVHTIDLPHLANGVYFVQYRTGQDAQTKKILFIK